MFWNFIKIVLILDPWKDLHPTPTHHSRVPGPHFENHWFSWAEEASCSLCIDIWFCNCRRTHWFLLLFWCFELCWSFANIQSCWRITSSGLEQMYVGRLAEYSSSYQMELMTNDPTSAWVTVLICCSVAFLLTSDLILSPSCESSVAEDIPNS